MRIVNAPEVLGGILQGGGRPLAPVVDIIAPVLSMPSGSPSTATSISGTVMTDEGNGTLYHYFSQSATPPSIANLKAGTGADAAGSQTITAAGMPTVVESGLVEDNTYYIHFLHTDAAGNDSNIATTAGILLTLALPVPTLTLLSGAGELLSFSIAGLVPEQVAGNFDWFVEVAGDVGFTTGPGAEPSVRTSQRQILLSDFTDDDADGNPEVEPFTATQSLPNGDVWVRISLKADDGTTGDPSNVITHTIAVQADITWSPTDKYIHALLDQADMRMYNNDANVGTHRGGRASAGRSTGRYYIEYYCTSSVDNVDNMYVGFANGTDSITGTLTPGLSNEGMSVRMGANIVYAGGGSVFDGTNASTSGQTVGLVIDIDLGKVWVYLNNVITNGDPNTDTGGYTYTITGNVFPWAAPRIVLYASEGIDYIELRAAVEDQLYSVPTGGGVAWNGATQD